MNPARMSGASIWLAVVVIGIGMCIAGCRKPLPEKAQGAQLENAPSAVGNQPISGKKILLVHSYHAEYPWVDAITRGVREALAGKQVELKIQYMDTKRRTDEQWKVEAGERARRVVEQYRPDVVITADDNAQQYFARYYVDTPLPVVFCGVNADPTKYGFPATNITGIIERPHFSDAVQFTNRLTPIRRIAILSSDDPTSVGALGFMKEELTSCEVLEYKFVNNFAEWKAAVERYNESVDAFGVYMYHTIKEQGADASLEPKQVMEWTIAHANVPTIGFFEFGVEDGLFAGVVESGEEHGERAARYALEILRGVPVSALPIVKAQEGLAMINRATAARLGVSLKSELAADARVVPED